MSQFRCVILAGTLSLASSCAPVKGEFRDFGANVLVGDSIAYGYGATPGHDLAACLGVATGARFVNRAVPGATTRDALRRLDVILALVPPTVIMSLGGNDLLHDLKDPGQLLRLHHVFPAAETLANLRRIWTEFRRLGTRVVYVDVTPPWSWRDLRTLYAHYDGRLRGIRDLAREFANVTVVEDAMKGIWTHPELMADELHPNDAGYAILCARVRTAWVAAKAAE